MNPQVSIIIINYKTPKLTIECIESLLKYTQWLNYEIILVDNWSWRESKKYFQQYLPPSDRIKTIYSPTNLWFGWWNNLWYSNSLWDYIFFLNSDTIVFENSIQILYHTYKKLSETNKVGIIWPRLYNDHLKRTIQIAWTQVPRLFTLIISTLPYLKNIYKQTYRSFLELDIWDRNSSKEQGAICWAAMFLSKNTFEDIWLFDQSFFLYMEENDLSIKLYKKRYHNFYTIDTSIVHLENQSSKKSRKKTFISLKSFIILLWKHRYFLFFGSN